LLAARGDHDAALRHIGRAAELAPNDALIQFMLGQTFARRGNVAFAEQAFRNALRLRPDMDSIKAWLGSMLVQGGRIAEAGIVYAGLLGSPDFEDVAFAGIGDVARAEERFEDAITAYRSSLECKPGQVPASLALGWTLARIGRFDEALAVYGACLAVNPDDSVHGARAQLLTALGRLSEAAAEWKTALARNPANLSAHAELARISERMGELNMADAHAAVVLSAGSDPAMLLLRARTLLRNDDLPGARDALDSLGRDQLSPELTAQRWNLLGRLHDRSREWTAAARCFAEAQRGLPITMPDYADPPPVLADILAETGATPWEQAPILLLGLPGSRVEHVAALLARQPGLSLNRQRSAQVFDDDFDRPRFERLLGEFGASECEEARMRWLASLHAAGIAAQPPVVEWLQHWDSRLLALVHRAMPGTRMVIVERDPHDELLNWLAFGWAPGFRCDDPLAAAQWLVKARRQLHWGADSADPRRLVVSADALLADPSAGAGEELARFLGIASFEGDVVAPRGLGGFPLAFEPGRWREYRDALAGAFSLLDG
jgi:tetratricopeptide (TPR) repeat protein